MTHIMVDLETYDNKCTSVILSIGATVFNPIEGTLGDSFYVVVNREGQTKLGLTESQETIDWWDKQSEEARSVLISSGSSLHAALADFGGWLLHQGSSKDLKIWGNGADFDNAILQHAHSKIGLRTPWGFWNNRCYRTLKAIAKSAGHVELDRLGTHHNALDDAIHQAANLIDIYRHLGLTHDKT